MFENAMEKTINGKNNAALLPVSRKFYDGIAARIADSFADLGETKSEAVCLLINDYMSDGKLPDADTDAMVRLAFSLLRPEIDKAMARSAAARSRRKRNKKPSGAKKSKKALAKKTKKADVPEVQTVESAETPLEIATQALREELGADRLQQLVDFLSESFDDNLTDANDDGAEAEPMKLNRRERRLREREARRQARRKNKRA